MERCIDDCVCELGRRERQALTAVSLLGVLPQILETASDIDPATLCLSNQPRGGENNVSAIKGNLSSLGIT